MSVMKVVPPVEIAPTMLASNVPETDNPLWLIGTLYKVGDKAMLNHRNYEALVEHTGKNPETDTSSPPVWLDLGPTNRWKMFNKRAGNTWTIGTFTSNPESIDLTVRPGKRINSIGLVGVRAASVQIQMIVGGSVVYDQTFSMSLKAGGSWYRYYFGAFKTKDNVARFDLPPFNNADIRVVALAPGGTARIGMMVIGMATIIGVAVHDTSIAIDSFSSVKEDDFGNVTIIPRGKRRSVDFDIVLASDQVSSVLRTLEPLSDTVALYVGSEGLDYTIIAGRFERLAMGLPTYGRAAYSLETRSLI
ncbi:hypothetical protein [Pseudomonas sp. 11/12A]|uniref:hypothetical protein n=1 Tax=Pseudomonas sp. 11/12A TaxID=1506582 RepID=UPI0006485E6B|nr:hypothetical protein [Pseudomonas sp. 11/12A]